MSLDVAMLCFTDLVQLLALPTAHDADGSHLFSQGARHFRVLVPLQNDAIGTTDQMRLNVPQRRNP